MDAPTILRIADSLRGQIHRVIVGNDAVIDLMLIGLLSEGHLLLEGAPGTAKTLLARTFASCLSLDFGRIQFTPDLMPGDIVGTSLFNFQTSQFVQTKGPIFTQLLLADEINRTPPKTQASLLEAMQERNVTVDGTRYELGDGFMVIATQNPIEQEGTYPLPEAQLDRFMFKVVMDYPQREQEIAIVASHGRRASMPDVRSFGIEPVADLGLIVAMRQFVQNVRLSDELVGYIVDLIRATREHPSLMFGASPRAASALAVATRAFAALQGRDYAIPDDAKQLAIPALRHRVLLAPGAEIDGADTARVVSDIVQVVPAPR